MNPFARMVAVTLSKQYLAAVIVALVDALQEEGVFKRHGLSDIDIEVFKRALTILLKAITRRYPVDEDKESYDAT